MKLNHLTRTVAGAAALGMVVSLAGCGGASSSSTAASSAASSEDSASSRAASDVSTDETAADPYSYLATFSFSDPFGDNGYLSSIKVADYVTLPESGLKFTLPAEVNTVAEDDIDAYINNNILLNYQTTEQVTDRAAEMGDLVNIDFVGSVDGVEFEGGSSQGAGYDITLGSGSFIDDFEDQIAGHTPGESFDVNVTFPDPYQNNPDLAGKEAVFKTTLNYISETVMPELTDEWVAENLSESFGLNDVAAVREDARANLLFEQQANEVYSQLLNGATFAEEMPEELVTYFENWYLYTPFMYSQMYGMPLSDMMTMLYGYDSVEAYLVEAEGAITSNVHKVLLMQAVAEETGATCDTDTMNAEAPAFFGTDDISGYVDTYGENYVKMNILHDLVIHDLIDSAVKE